MLRLLLVGIVLATTLLGSTGAAAQAGRQGPPPMVAIPTPTFLGALPLYPQGAPKMPGAATHENWGTFDTYYRVVRNVTQPTITPYLPHPSKATGAAVIVAPGGGFQLLAYDAEGDMVARWLAERGVAAFLLKYRVQPTPPNIADFEKMGAARAAETGKPSAAGASPRVFQPAIDDGVAAMRFVRAGAAGFGVDPKRVGMIGFSAGAINALSVMLTGPADARPDFLGLIYGPMGPVTVPTNAPPMFAALAADDPLFGRGGFGLIDSWRQAGIPVEFHLYQSGSHGFGIRPVGTTATLWPEQFLAWMASNKLLGNK